ncbi:MAG TPA: helix-hairpin-helix domain-containing protein, partial [Opitutales bacterium]|nr:helix-hairpin-helix domain-containing protein [Opitutales bacterium]
RKLGINRVYFSAYQRGLGRKDIPGEQRESGTKEEGFLREHRLYQVDFLLRKYGFEKDEIPFDTEGHLIRDRDPKRVWAEGHPERFPIDVNTASASELLRVPGIGPETAKRIVLQRKTGRINSFDHLPFKGKRLTDARAFLKV